MGEPAAAPDRAIMLTDLSGIKNFDTCGDQNSVGIRWTKWIRSFELFAVGKGVKDPDQKKALLLHCAGEAVQDIFFTLTIPNPGEGEDEYTVCKQELEKQFGSQINVPYERSLFRAMAQKENETIEQYLVRLTERGKLCQFTDLNEMLRDQVIEKCNSSRLRRKLLEQRDLNLNKLREIAQALEQSLSQAEAMEKLSTNFANRVKVKKPEFGQRRKDDKSQSRYKKTIRCFACGFEGHIRKDDNCPAKNRKCRKCSNVGHFEKCCKTKDRPNGKKNFNYKKDRVRAVETKSDSEESESDAYAFSVASGKWGRSMANLTVGGVKVDMLVDSGASVNVISKNVWEEMKHNKIVCESRRTNKRLYGYGNPKPLTVIGCFDAVVGTNNVECNAEFIVIREQGESLLGSKTATELGLLKISSSELIHAVKASKSDILKQYPECFEGIGRLKDYQLTIPIDKEVTPVVQPLRRVPYHLRDKLDAKLDELLEKDIIEKVDGPSEWISPVVVIPKVNGEIRLCIDMRAANHAVKRERYTIPTVEEVLQDLNQGKVFSKLDIKWAYHQIELKAESREITTFMTHRGLFRYKRLMFGVSCAPEMYNKLIHQALEGCEGVHSIFDDIVVHGSSVEEHDTRLEKVMMRIRDKGLTLNAAKCQIGMDHIEFMGHVLSEHGISLSGSKADDVMAARRPETPAEVRSFLGLVNFSARFIPNLATISEPLRKLTKKSVAFEWGDEQENAFTQLKDALANAKTLGYYDTDAKTQVIADASPVGLGGVLVQKQGAEYRVIMYASRSLTDVERRYSQTEKEALGLVWACERFKMYLQGTNFELVTDHKPLQCIFGTRSKPCARIERWVLRLLSFKFHVTYIPGPRNIADALSRLVRSDKSESAKENKTEQYIRMICQDATPVAMTTREIERETAKDTELTEVLNCLRTGQWHKLSCKSYLPVRSEISCLGTLLLRGTRIIIPKSLQEKVLTLAHEGHPGIVVMKQRLRSKVWWPGIDKKAENWCRTCHGCQLVAKPMNPEPLIRTELPAEPWNSLAADYLGPLPSGDYLFVVVDYHSRWIEVVITKSTTAEKTVDMLRHMFATHGLPMSLKTDNGPQFVSDKFKQYMNEMGINHHRVTPLYPQANGEVERQNRSILKRIRVATAENKDWKQELQNYLLMYRATAHSVTGVSPAEVLFGRRLRTKLPDLRDYQETESEMRDRDAEQKEKGKIYTDQKRRATENNLKQGDLVLMKQNRDNKLATNFNPKPMVVVEKNKNSVVVESDEKVRYKRNVTHLKKFHVRKNEFNVPNQSVTSNENSEKINESEKFGYESASRERVDTDLNDETEFETLDEEKPPDNLTAESRPTRMRKMPEKFKDYQLYK